MKSRFLILLLIVLVFGSCKRKLSNEEICSFNWKYYSGKWFGDFYDCRGLDCEVKTDTLFILGKPGFRILFAWHDGLARNDKMKITNLQLTDTAVYVAK